MKMDKMGNMPNQLSDGDFDECVSLTVTDIAGNIDSQLYSPDFTYASTIFLEGKTPGDQGTDPWTGFQSAVAYGLLPQANATITAKNQTELYSSNWTNYPQDQRTLALKNQKLAPKNVGMNYYDVISYIRATGYGVALPLTWFSSFMEAPNGVLHSPSGTLSNHCVAAYLDDDGTTLLIKPWLGSSWGRGGYGILTQQMFNAIVIDAYSFDPNGNHWLAILGILITKYPYLIDRYQQLAQAPFPPKIYLPITDVYPMTPQETALYTAVKNNLGKHLTLNASVPPDVGCAECVSKLLSLAGISVPKAGIPGTAALLAWLQANPDFTEVDAPEQGVIVISATDSGNGSIEGHTGIVCAFNLMYVQDFGIASNDSNTGTLREQWCLKDWIAYYEVSGGMKTHYFRYV